MGIIVAVLLNINKLLTVIFTILTQTSVFFTSLYLYVAQKDYSEYFLLKTLAKMVSYKSNKLHLHLVNNNAAKQLTLQLIKLRILYSYCTKKLISKIARKLLKFSYKFQ